jgi:GT2 family glycosyltransferase
MTLSGAFPDVSLLETNEPTPGVISVVVVNWNGADHLAECLASLQFQANVHDIEIIVVDNGSTDNSADVIDSYSGRVRAVRNADNLGFAAGCNQGIRTSRGEYVALVNNDAVVDPAWLQELIGAIRKDPSIGCCTSKVLSYQNHGVIDNVGHVIFADGLTRGRGRLQVDNGQFEREEEVFSFSGCAALLRARMLDDIGLFDEHFFAYCEDADLGFRARLRGWRCIYVPTAIAYHKYSASTQAFSGFKAFHVERNRIWLAVKNLPLPLLVLSPFFTLLRYFWQCYGVFSGEGASSRFVKQNSSRALFHILLRAYIGALAGLPWAIRERRRIQRTRTAPALQVLRHLRRFGVGARQIALLE